MKSLPETIPAPTPKKADDELYTGVDPGVNVRVVMFCVAIYSTSWTVPYYIDCACCYRIATKRSNLEVHA